MIKFIKNVFPRLVVFTGFIIIWSLISTSTNNLIPNPYRVLLQILEFLKTPAIYSDIIFTLFNSVISLGISFLIAGFYVLLSEIFSKSFRAYTRPILSTLLFIPAIIFVYICIIIFGYNTMSLRLVIILIVAPQLITSFSSFPGQINNEYLKISRVFHLNIITTFKKIIIPQIAPLIVSAISIGFSTASRISILAEAIIGNKGIGYLIAYNFYLFDLEKVLALSTIIIVVILVFPSVIYGIYKILSIITKKYLLWK